jgi:hypothetical protein
MVKQVNRASLVRLFLISILAAVALAISACAEADTSEQECQDGGERWTEYRLFMGRGDGDQEVVSDADWDSFLADTITPRFPDGLSVIDVAGQGSTADGSIERERTKMLLILAPPGDGPLDRMNEIGAEYKQRFNRNSVLRVVTKACVAFK